MDNFKRDIEKNSIKQLFAYDHAKSQLSLENTKHWSFYY